MMLRYVHGEGLEDVVLGLICVPALAQGCVRNANLFQMCFQTTVPCAQAENGLFVGLAPGSVWGQGAPGSCCGWPSWP